MVHVGIPYMEHLGDDICHLLIYQQKQVEIQGKTFTIPIMDRWLLGWIPSLSPRGGFCIIGKVDDDGQ